MSDTCQGSLLLLGLTQVKQRDLETRSARSRGLGNAREACSNYGLAFSAWLTLVGADSCHRLASLPATLGLLFSSAFICDVTDLWMESSPGVCSASQALVLVQMLRLGHERDKVKKEDDDCRQLNSKMVDEEIYTSNLLLHWTNRTPKKRY